jgi:hypothetical protein
MSNFDIKIIETNIKKDKKIVYEATLTYKGDNTEFIDYIKSLNAFHNLSEKYLEKLASVMITFYTDRQVKPYEYKYDDDKPDIVYYENGYDGILNGFYNMLTGYKLDTQRFSFLKQLKGISYAMLLCCICKAIKERLVTLSSTIILEASGGIIDMNRVQSIGNLVKYYERIGFKKMFPDYYDIAIKSDGGYIPMIAQVKDIISLCNFKNVSKELLTILPTDLCRNICTEKEDNVSYICDKLTKTYNTNILDLASDDIKDQFLITSVTHRDGNEGKKVLMNLICNHFNKDSDKQKPTPRFIGGPKNLTVHYSKKYNKMIYIFGEYHSDIVDCDIRFGDESSKEEWDKPNSKKMRVEYFLSEFIRTTDVFLDIFVEFPIIPKKEGKYHNDFDPFLKNIRINKLLENFKECIQRDTRTEVCNLARIHFFDIRSFDNQGKLSSSNKTNYFYHKLDYIFTFVKDERIKKLKLFVEDKVIKEVLFDLSHPDVNEFKKIWINNLTNLSYNKKELERLQNDDPKMKDTILHFIQKEITETVMQYRDIWKKNVSIINNHEHKVAEFIAAFISIHQSIAKVNALYTDLYTLLRIFKTFNMSEIKEKAYKQATDQPDKAHNIIIYGGDFHGQTYRKFFTDILNFDKIEVAGKEEPYKKMGEKMYCIDMKTIKQPLFSKYHELDRTTDERKQDTTIEEKRQSELKKEEERRLNYFEEQRVKDEKEEERRRNYFKEQRVKDEKEAVKRQFDIAELAERKRKEKEKEDERRRNYFEEQRVKDEKEAVKRQFDIAELAERNRKKKEKEDERRRNYFEEQRVKDEKEAARRLNYFEEKRSKKETLSR